MADLPNLQNTIVPVGESVSKEREFGPVTRPSEKAPIPVVEVNKIPETQAEKEGYITRVEKDFELKKPVTDDSGQVLVSPPAPQSPKIVLPVTQATYLTPSNWHLPITSALKWLLEWSKRIAKSYPGRTMFRN
ncbi:MAG: hypothetical protein Q8Q24_01550 [bacterium]|nr:hypothetical protein [bacterium]